MNWRKFAGTPYMVQGVWYAEFSRQQLGKPEERITVDYHSDDAQRKTAIEYFDRILKALNS